MKKRIVITGATGLLGRNLLFEIIKQNLNNLDKLEIFILGRNNDKASIRQRIQQIILKDGLSYIGIPKERYECIRNFSETGIKCIDMDLDEYKLKIKPEDLKKLKSEPINLFFHIAALTDFRNTPKVIDALKKTNFEGTKKIIKLISSLKIHEFCYVGSAYSCGETTGDIKPDYINLNQKFRNPYEKIKLESEIIVRDFAKKSGMRCRYFRPSTICGRLIEPPLGSISKFDVFYSWAAFFLYMKLKQLGLSLLDDKYEIPVDFNIHICYSLKSGVNIIPADYAAKVIYQVCTQEDPGGSYHLANNQETPHDLQISTILKAINIKKTKQSDSIPERMNRLESFYYRTMGGIYTPYMTSAPMLFNIQNLDNVLRKSRLNCPPINGKNFSILINYAKQYDFGLK